MACFSYAIHVLTGTPKPTMNSRLQTPCLTAHQSNPPLLLCIAIYSSSFACSLAQAVPYVSWPCGLSVFSSSAAGIRVSLASSASPSSLSRRMV